MLGRHNAVFEIVETQIADLNDIVLNGLFINRGPGNRIQQLKHDDIRIDLVNGLGALPDFGLVILPKTIEISRNGRDVVLAQKLNKLSKLLDAHFHGTFSGLRNFFVCPAVDADQHLIETDLA